VRKKIKLNQETAKFINRLALLIVSQLIISSFWLFKNRPIFLDVIIIAATAYLFILMVIEWIFFRYYDRGKRPYFKIGAMRFMKKILYFLSVYVWQGVQNLTGYVMSRLWKKRLTPKGSEGLTDASLEELKQFEKDHDVKIYVSDYETQKKDKLLGGVSGFSMGKYICLSNIYDLTAVKHEYGHSIQSKYLGPFYLLTVGVYSALFCNVYAARNLSKWKGYDRGYWYYVGRWTEKWADKLGGVDRLAWLRQKYPTGGKIYKEGDIVGLHPLLPTIVIILIMTSLGLWTYSSYLRDKENKESAPPTVTETVNNEEN